MPEPFFIEGIPEDQIQGQIDFVRMTSPGASVESIAEGNGKFTLKVVFPTPEPTLPPAGGINWAQAPAMDAAGLHTQFPGGRMWAYDNRGITLNGTVVRSNGEPATCTAILATYGQEILDAAMAHDIPPELIVMTIATETGSNRKSKFTGPNTFRWEAHITDYSAGPMQTLGATASSMIDKFHLPHPKPPKLSSKPMPPPSSNPLYDGRASIDIGTAYIRNNRGKTGLDPILVAACYNAGSIRQDPGSPWRLKTFGEHLNRAAEWFGDACALLADLRQGRTLDRSVIKPAPEVSVQSSGSPNSFALTGLSKAEADDEEEQFRLGGATVQRLPEPGGTTFRLEVDFPGSGGSAGGGPVDASGIPVPDRDGYVICVSRRRKDSRSGNHRTVGVYQAFFNKVPIDNIKGTAVEPKGPGDNDQSGVASHARLEAGYYPLFTHERPNQKYRTLNYAATGNVKSRPWPSVRIEDTGSRSGVLIHCAGGFMMSIGCVNLASALPAANSDIQFDDSRKRVIALIDSMKTKLPNFPNSNNRRIEDAWLRIVDDPS
ncbi:MAG: hypothetical protein K2Z80_15580 [Xanthobacteraceae bacterium]|nr:hypothetical protein [Xanthobacteraceae bacterium]